MKRSWLLALMVLTLGCAGGDDTEESSAVDSGAPDSGPEEVSQACMEERQECGGYQQACCATLECSGFDRCNEQTVCCDGRCDYDCQEPPRQYSHCVPYCDTGVAASLCAPRAEQECVTYEDEDAGGDPECTWAPLGTDCVPTDG